MVHVLVTGHLNKSKILWVLVKKQVEWVQVPARDYRWMTTVYFLLYD